MLTTRGRARQFTASRHSCLGEIRPRRRQPVRQLRLSALLKPLGPTTTPRTPSDSQGVPQGQPGTRQRGRGPDAKGGGSRCFRAGGTGRRAGPFPTARLSPLEAACRTGSPEKTKSHARCRSAGHGLMRTSDFSPQCKPAVRSDPADAVGARDATAFHASTSAPGLQTGDRSCGNGTGLAVGYSRE